MATTTTLGENELVTVSLNDEAVVELFDVLDELYTYHRDYHPMVKYFTGEARGIQYKLSFEDNGWGHYRSLRHGCSYNIQLTGLEVLLAIRSYQILSRIDGADRSGSKVYKTLQRIYNK